MRHLILMGVLAMTLPGVAAAETGPAKEPTAPQGVPATLEPTEAEAPPAAEPEVAESEPARPPVPASAVARGTFTTAIDQREPVDRIDSLGNDHDRVFYFTEFVGVGGRQLTHRWEYEGEVKAEVPISIDGPRWRAYSSKNLAGGWLGEWKVSVVDETGNVVRTDSFVYEAAPPEPEIAEAETTPAPTAETTPAPAAETSPAPAGETAAETAAGPAASEASEQAPASAAPARLE